MSEHDTQPAPVLPMEECDRIISHILDEYWHFMHEAALENGSADIVAILNARDRLQEITDAVFAHYGTTSTEYLEWSKQRLNFSSDDGP